MSESSEPDEAVSILQELGLKEYEAKCFVALSRLPKATAKEISDISDVPRTRVYDAANVLESKGLVEVQHSNPQQFRATDIETAVETLETEYESRLSELETLLETIDPVQRMDTGDEPQEVWTLSGSIPIERRSEGLIGEAASEVRLLVRTESCLGDAEMEALEDAVGRGVDVYIGTATAETRDALADDTAGVSVFVAEAGWLLEGKSTDSETVLNRIMAVDKQTILVSSTHNGDGDDQEFATLGSGFRNGLVVILRRLLSNETQG
jgi:sugar-specific transcriptional regulator TrmB